MQWIPCSLVKCLLIECSGFHAAWLISVYSMQHEEREPYWMQWSLCRMAQSIPIECSGFNAASLNAEDSMHCCAMDPDCIQWRPRSEDKCILNESSGFYAAWPKTSRLSQWISCSVVQLILIECTNSMHQGAMVPDWMHWIPCGLLKFIPIECIGFHAALFIAVDTTQRVKIHPDWMQWIPCSIIECRGFHAA